MTSKETALIVVFVLLLLLAIGSVVFPELLPDLW